jgi:hypothetical protein
MAHLVTFMKWEVLVFFGVLSAIVALELLTGQINCKGLFRDNSPRAQNTQFSSAKVQLMVLTIGAASYYLSQVLENPKPGSFPSIPETWPVLLGGSNQLYLGGKAYSRWFGQRKTP